MPFFLALLLIAAPLVPRERAVMIYPREHAVFRHVFYTRHQRDLQRELRREFDLQVHDQVGTADQMFAIDVRGARLLVLSGHGSPFSMSLDGRDAATLTGMSEPRLRAFFSELAPDATIILQSCYTGLSFARVVKEAAGPGRHVIAAYGEVPRDGLQITSLAPVDARLRCRHAPDCTVRFR
ncbi:MAG TPA: hypothetical protein VKH35_17445 [Thermoanaerobaculia bacterium]|jgi:hypothetical protein|nr:hypothetical protein [Thermoanaerobaculia bacterium]